MFHKAWFHILTTIIFLTSIYFFYQHQFFGAVVFLVMGILRLNNLHKFPNIVQSIIRPSDIERRANFHLRIEINLENVVTHPTLEAVFAKLPKSKTGTENFKEWGEKLLSNFKKRAKSEDAWHSVSFNIKNGLLFKDEKLDYLDTIYDEVHLPYQYSEEKSWSPNSIDKAITVRIVVINGSLNLEIGRFSKESSPEVYKDGFLATYQHYKKITDFPLLLLGFSYGLPSRYFNSIFKASDSYKDKFLKKKKESSNDWRQYNQDLVKYEELVTDADSVISNHTDLKTYQEMIKDFHIRAGQWLVKEEYLDPSKPKDDDFYWRWDDGSAIYNNKFLRIELSDWNRRLETMQENLFPDYWEEQP